MRKNWREMQISRLLFYFEVLQVLHLNAARSHLNLPCHRQTSVCPMSPHPSWDEWRGTVTPQQPEQHPVRFLLAHRPSQDLFWHTPPHCFWLLWWSGSHWELTEKGQLPFTQKWCCQIPSNWLWREATFQHALNCRSELTAEAILPFTLVSFSCLQSSQAS